MSLLPAHRQHVPMLSDFNDLWNSMLRPASPGFGTFLLRLEDAVEEGRYVVRAEIPGVEDPAKDIEVSIQNGQLAIRAERSERHVEKGRSEFSYGSFVRAVTLPAGAQDEGVEATYGKGILTVTVPLAEPQPAAKSVEVKSAE
ncbi:Hsp20/alpha crystallin family protein [Nocardia sp. CDC153]|uniref:Hsp20/alpha crystallin family protein n=1 Tax=Nocardia sp. CDC153 TaxID=3112167 RepID=UPI002DC01467|nr:Hsp20/alpha crystallin family protein [Nocardia sp. CDC153]MEC3956667.1 Hsp20/alpha crystallin family protein [Nocardia sp. CDC153]